MPSDGVFILVADDGRVIDWSTAAQETFGWSPQEALGRHIGELVREGDGASGIGTLASATVPPLAVRPVLTDSALVWEVRASDGTDDGWTSAVLRALSGCSPLIFHVLDRDLRIVQVSDDAGGGRASSLPLLGGVSPDAYGLAVPEKEAEVARRVLATGEAALDRVVRARVPGASRAKHYSLSYIRLESLRSHIRPEGPHSIGDVMGLVVLALDVTDRVRAMQRLKILEVVRGGLGEHLDVIAECRALTDAVVPAFCGIAAVDVVEDVVRGEDPPLAPVDNSVPLLRAAFRGPIAAHPVGEVSRLPVGTPFSRVLADLRPRLVPVDHDSPWLPADPDRAAAIAQSAAHSLIVAPLALRGQAMGVVSFYRHGTEEPFDEEDIALTADVCAHAALCIDNARRYARERTIATTIKRRLLPQRPTATSAVDFAHLHIPGPGAGGAWFDVIELAGARTALVLGDVAGRGIATATTMGQLRTAIHSLVTLDLEPDELMARLGDTAARLAADRAALPAGDSLHAQPLTAGCLIAVYDAVEQRCTIVRAGLSDPYAVYPDGSSARVPVPEGPVLAGSDHAPFPATTVDLPEGSTLALGNEDLLAPSGQVCALLAAGVDQPLADLCDTVAYALRNRDETERLLLLGRVKAFPGDQVMVLPLPAENQAAPLARAATRRQLEAWNIGEEDAFTAEIIVSELVGNAVRYGAPPHRLRLILDQRLTCEVSDAAQCAPHLKHARTVDEDGRGLFIIASLADNWGTRYSGEGKTVWAQQSTNSPP
ncbi:SpoIIE family protein phosphatase [Streptomyces sp. NPDC048297]|uniref:ATP-binding SpoIIE family protein phosphatase n=1 Tax=Streptomyces sp. NPDC048297 TaxID=3365531 RepID=UPI00371AD08C